MRLWNAKGRVNTCCVFEQICPHKAACIQRRIAPEYAGRFLHLSALWGLSGNGSGVPLYWQCAANARLERAYHHLCLKLP